MLSRTARPPIRSFVCRAMTIIALAAVPALLGISPAAAEATTAVG
jgi:hypothetical protein